MNSSIASIPSSLSPSEAYLAPRSKGARIVGAAAASRILLVDDDRDLRTLLTAVLSAAGYIVRSAPDAEEAILYTRSAPAPHLLLTDLQMPGLNGLELAQVLTTMQPALPVLLISGSTLSLSSAATVRARGWRFLPKPFRIPHLLSEIHSLLSTPGYAAS